jgi:hypothetical protein
MNRARSSHLPRIACAAEECTAVFVPYHRHQRFCSPKCREIERARERRAIDGKGSPSPRKRFTCDALLAAMLNFGRLRKAL